MAHKLHSLGPTLLSFALAGPTLGCEADTAAPDDQAHLVGTYHVGDPSQPIARVVTIDILKEGKAEVQLRDCGNWAPVPADWQYDEANDTLVITPSQSDAFPWTSTENGVAEIVLTPEGSCNGADASIVFDDAPAGQRHEVRLSAGAVELSASGDSYIPGEYTCTGRALTCGG